MLGYKTIIILPKPSDNWVQDPPIFGLGPVVKGLAFSNSKEDFGQDYTQVYSYYKKSDEVSSELDFLTMTKQSNTVDKTIIKPVGGVVNLKDFKFTLRRENLDIKALIGCEVLIYKFRGTQKLEMTCKVSSANGNGDTATFTCKGKLNLEDSVFHVEDSVSAFGETQMIKLQKRTDDFGNTRLIFNPKKYSIKGLFIKEKKDEFSKVDEEASYVEVATNYDIIEDEIIFEGLIPDETLYGGQVAGHANRHLILDKAWLLVGELESDAGWDWLPEENLYSRPQFERACIYYFEKKVFFDNKEFSLYWTNSMGSYESLVSELHLNGIYTGSGRKYSMSSFIPLKQPRIPLSLMYIYGYETMLEYIKSGDWRTKDHKVGISTSKVSRQKVRLQFDGVPYSCSYINPYSTSALTALDLDSGPVPQEVESVRILNQDSTEDYISLFMNCPLKGIQNYGGGEIFEGRSDWELKIPTGDRLKHSDAVFSPLFDIPNISGDVVSPELNGFFLTKLPFSHNLPSYVDTATCNLKFSLSGKNNHFGQVRSGWGIDKFGGWDWGNKVRGMYLSSVYSGYRKEALSYGGYAKSSLDGRWHQNSDNGWEYRTKEDRPVNISDWKSETTSFILEKGYGEYPAKCSVSKDTELSFILEAGIKDNTFYAKVDDLLNVSGLPIKSLTIKGLRSVSDLGNGLIGVVSFDNAWRAEIYPLVGDLTRIIGMSTTDKAGLFFCKDRYGSVGLCAEGLFYSFDGLHFQKGTVAQYTVDLTDKDNYFQTDNYIVQIEGESLNIYERTDLNDSSNPVTLIKSLLTVGSGYSDSDFDLPSFSSLARAREGWKARFITKSTVSVISAVNQVTRESGLILYENVEGKFSLMDLNPPQEADVSLTLTDSSLVIEKDLVNVKERYFPISYLISDLDIEYFKIESEFTKTIFAKDFPNQVPFNVAKSYLSGKPRQNRIQLSSILDDNTAQKIGDLNMLYHSIPNRVLTFKSFDFDVPIGEWFKIQTPLVEGSTGNLYLCLRSKSLGFQEELTVFEFDIDSIQETIREVPFQVDSWNENVTATEQIQEVPVVNK